MIKHINSNDFQNAFIDSGRENNFSREALNLLFDYKEQLEDDAGEQIEVDVIDICCHYSELTIEEAESSYNGIDLSECESIDDKVNVITDFFNDNTTLIGITSDNTFVIAQF
jgi:hypothetical protein